MKLFPEIFNQCRGQRSISCEGDKLIREEKIDLILSNIFILTAIRFHTEMLEWKSRNRNYEFATHLPRSLSLSHLFTSLVLHPEADGVCLDNTEEFEGALSIVSSPERTKHELGSWKRAGQLSITAFEPQMETIYFKPGSCYLD